MHKSLSLLCVSALLASACAPDSPSEGVNTVTAELASPPVELAYAHGVNAGCSSCVSWWGFLTVENLAYNKDVTVVYAVAGQWREAQARFVEMLPNGRELWTFERVAGPGPFRFALRYRVDGKEFWDNAGGSNYRGEVTNVDGMGLVTRDATLGHGRDIAVTYARVDGPTGNEVGPQLSVAMRVRNRAFTKQVRVLSTVDGWNNVVTSDARYDYGNDAQQWIARIPLDPQAQTVEFTASSEMTGREDWDNNFGRNFRCASNAQAIWKCQGSLLR